MKIKVIVPITTESMVEETEKEVQEIVSRGTSFDVECLDYGTASIESYYDEELAAPGIIAKAEKAEKEGFDGVFIDCMGDPAIGPVREKLDIPVVGPARASALYAADLAHKFSIVSPLESTNVLTENLIKEAGLSEKLASIRSVEIPVLELENLDKLQKALNKTALKAIEEDGAHAVVLGCTGMMGVADGLSTYLKNNGYNVPVIYPVEVAIRHLESLISLDLKQSRRTYMKPPKKDRNIWEALE